MKVVPCISGNDWKTTITLKKKDSKLWYWKVFHIPMTRKNKERYAKRIKERTLFFKSEVNDEVN